MKKIALIIVMLLATATTFAQEVITYRYIIAEPDGLLFSDKCELKIDDGVKIYKAKDENDKTYTFKSYAAALMYLTLQGWELVSNYNTVRGSSANGTGATSSSTYWILRMPSTKEEVQEIVDKSINKKAKKEK